MLAGTNPQRSEGLCVGRLCVGGSVSNRRLTARLRLSAIPAQSCGCVCADQSSAYSPRVTSNSNGAGRWGPLSPWSHSNLVSYSTSRVVFGSIVHLRYGGQEVSVAQRPGTNGVNGVSFSMWGSLPVFRSYECRSGAALQRHLCRSRMSSPVQSPCTMRVKLFFALCLEE